MPRNRILVAALTVVALACAAPTASAHTDTDYVAVAAGSEATVTLKPTHGCGASPTTKVSTRLPIAGASAVDVLGWTATTTQDEQGRTVIDWAGGSLPADEVGAFPVRFTTPNEPGELLLFPFIQECADGAELSWISGDPASDNPAPRLLVLPPGSASAETLDDVPADAPGRDQLAQVVDVDNPQAEPSTTTTSAPTSSTSPPTTTADEASEDDGTSVPWIPIILAAAVVGAIAALVLRRRSS